MNGNFHRGIRRFCSIVIGAVFLLSALLKLMDPVGTGLIVKEYLNFFHIGFLSGLSDFIGSFLAFIEAAVAVLMMFGVFRRFTALFSGVVILSFTILTLILLIFNPEMECGWERIYRRLEKLGKLEFVIKPIAEGNIMQASARRNRKHIIGHIQLHLELVLM